MAAAPLIELDYVATDSHALAIELVRLAGHRPTGHPVDVGAGRGVFSTVLQVPVSEAPFSLVVKTPAPGPDGATAAASGACAREALAYRELLPGTTIARPQCHLVAAHPDDGRSLVLEDLGRLRMGQQASGLARADAEAVVVELARWHTELPPSAADGLGLRRNTPASLPLEALKAGLDHLERFRADEWRSMFGAIVERRDELAADFAAASVAVITHGDPRGDNVAFNNAGDAVLFDFQQIAVQLPEADLAWLTATSLTPEDRRAWEHDLLGRYAEERSLPLGDVTARYRLGFLLPACAVLLLAQRRVDDSRSEAMVARSLGRIATAVADVALAP